MCERYVTVCSSGRARALWPSPSDYQVELADGLRDVCSVRLRDARVPVALPTDCGRDRLHVSVGGGAEAAARAASAPGAFSLPAFLASLEAALCAAASPEAFAVRAASDGVVTLYCTAAFEVSAGDGQSYRGDSMAGALGLPPVPAAASAPLAVPVSFSAGPLLGHALACPFPNALQEPLDVYLQVDGFELLRDGGAAAPAGGGSCFEVVCGRGAPRAAGAAAVRRFHPPLARLSRLRVRLRAEDGGLLDFGNRDHRLDLLLEVGPSAQGRTCGFAPAACQ